MIVTIVNLQREMTLRFVIMTSLRLTYQLEIPSESDSGIGADVSDELSRCTRSIHIRSYSTMSHDDVITERQDDLRGLVILTLGVVASVRMRTEETADLPVATIVTIKVTLKRPTVVNV